MLRLLPALLVGLVLLGACKAAEPARRDEEPAAPPPGSWVEVKKGDTLWRIAKRHGVTVDEVAEVNGVDPAAPIVPGQLLFLPDSSEAAPQPAEAPAAAADEGPAATLADLGWPLEEGVLLRDFGAEGRVPYEGLMLAAPAGTPVLAAAPGEVLFVGDEGNSFGTLVIVRHGPELVTVYAHLEDTVVRRGARVTKGEVLGSVGVTGRAESPQLHFQVRAGRFAVDPLAHLPPP